MLVCDFVPELGVFNAAVLGDEHRVETEFLLLFKVLKQGCNGLDQEQKTQQVEPCDETDADVGNIPDKRGAVGAAVNGHDDLDHDNDSTDDLGLFLIARQEDDVGPGIVAEREKRGEREEQNGDGDESGAKAGEDSVDRGLGVAGAGLNAGKGLHKCVARAVNDIVAAGAEDHQTGSGADDERVDVNGERLSETLLDGVRDLSRRGGLRAGTLTGFGRVDTALHAPHDGRAEDCTERSFLIEGAAEDEAEHGGNSRDICPQNDDHQYNIHTSRCAWCRRRR